jgi:alkanesulfonate monooxygenase SsuD/methylene tetrahydromethanopterin reductase-like flavin-dependent oxidoreductase (luciferase family)
MPSHAHEDIKRQADAYRRLAFDEYKRELQLWSYAYVVQCDTQREAEDYLNYYVVERGDDAAVDNLAKIFLTETEILPAEVIEQFKFHFKAGWGGYPLVGTADQIAQRLIDLQKTTGLNGMLLSWVDYRDGLERFSRDVLPLLQQAGLRSPVRAHSGAG